MLDALGNPIAYTYDAKDNVLSVTDPKGVVIETNAYDLRNRLTTRTDALNQTQRQGLTCITSEETQTTT